MNKSKHAMTVGIVGGGIGGLSAALALRQAGIDVHVFERSETFREIGAGIQISANASRLLRNYGLGDELDKVSVRPSHWHQRRWDDGRTLLKSPLAGVVEQTFGSPHYNIHRADLIDILTRALPADRLHSAHRLTSLVDRGHCVDLAFENGVNATFDAVIGADGIHSTVRHALFGPERPHFTGCVAYRGIVPVERLASLQLETTSQVWMGPERHLVHYFVRNKQLVSFVAVVNQDSWTSESWTSRGEVTEALQAFEGWHPHVRTILGSVDEIFVWALLDRLPMNKWSVNRVTLLGDACHAMLPMMAQGAAQAIEDGATLAKCFVDSELDVADALARYETLRLPRTSRIQGLSDANKRRFHMPDGPEQIARDAEMARGTTDWSMKAIAWIYGYDASHPEPLSAA